MTRLTRLDLRDDPPTTGEDAAEGAEQLSQQGHLVAVTNIALS